VAPLVQGRSNTDAGIVVLFSIAATVAGSAVGAITGFVGRLSGIPQSVRMICAVLGLAVLAARELRWIQFRLPDLALIVPRRLVAVAPSKAAAIWGAYLGAGVLTIIGFGAVWGLQLIIFALAKPGVGAAIGAVYGTSRSAPAVAISSIGPARRAWERASPWRHLPSIALRRAGAVAMIVCSLVFGYEALIALL